MEKFALTLQSQNDVMAYAAGKHLMRYEREILDELVALIEKGDAEGLAWFAGFGDSFRQILMNVNEHRKALEFGFTEIAFTNTAGLRHQNSWILKKLNWSKAASVSGAGLMGFGLML